MRIVAGTAGGRRIVAPEGETTRPTSERVREATFNALYSLGEIEDRRFCDLYAGSGALGLEALSRGAGWVTFVERDPAARRAIETNIEALGFGDRCDVVAGDALSWLGRGVEFDVVVADPPYGFAAWDELLAKVRARLLVAEAAEPVDPEPPWASLRTRRYGSTVVTILRHEPTEADS